MYLRRIELENTGPIPYLNYTMPFADTGAPRPAVFVGRNGSGKSIVLSHVVSGLLAAKGVVYDDAEVDRGKVYKLRSPLYIRDGADFSRSHLEFDQGLFQGEITLRLSRSAYEAKHESTPLNRHWNDISEDDFSTYYANFHEKQKNIENEFKSSTVLYFPPDRFEQPAWLNEENLQARASYVTSRKISGRSGRPVINQSPLAANQNWLLDILYDSNAIERRGVDMALLPGMPRLPGIALLIQDNGPATRLKAALESFLAKLFEADPPFLWGVGGRGQRSISVSTNNRLLIPNLFSLSTGQLSLLNIFISIIRDADLSGNEFTGINNVKGTVIIDEVDAHLHTNLQYELLPELISLFPRIQFIMTCQSPIFLMGLRQRLGEGGLRIMDLPGATEISPESFSEFEDAYKRFTSSARFDDDLRKSISESQKPVLFVEGAIDVDILARAANLLGRENIAERYRVLDANGFGGLNNIWRHFDVHIAEALNQRVVLLYDCDISVLPDEKGRLTRRVMNTRQRRISKGIENMFPDALIEAARIAHPEFVDVRDGYRVVKRGVETDVAEEWSINRDEKRNFATWVIANGTAGDFREFDQVFDMIAELVA